MDEKAIDGLRTRLAVTQVEDRREPSSRRTKKEVATSLTDEVPIRSSACRSPTFYLVCATPRSGSGLLCDGLWRRRSAGYPDEFFQHAQLPTSRWPPQDPKTYFRKVFEGAATPNRVGGAKIMWSDFQRLASVLSPDDPPCFEALADMLPPLRYIWISRRDKVSRAVSLAKATQTGIWRVVRGTKPTERTADHRIGNLDWYVRRLTRHDGNWKHFFEFLDIEPLRVEYENLAAEYELTMRRVFKYLGVNVNSLAPPSLKRQADASVALYRSWVSGRPIDL